MKKVNKTIKSKCDGLDLSITVTIPENNVPIKGIVQFSHGMSEHKERYYPFMEFLADNGYIGVINDHRGHGESIKNDEDLGYFYDETGRYIVEDLHQVTEEIKKEYPDLSVYMFGHSMGTLVSRCYLKHYDYELDKLILCGAPCKNGVARLGILLTKIIGKFKGDKYRSKFLNNITISSFSKKFKDEKEDPTCWVCSDKKTREKYRDDKKSGYVFTLNGFRNLYKLVLNTYSEKEWEKQNLELPIFFIAGDEDPVIGGISKWIKAYEFIQNDIGYKNVTHKLYKGKRHELLNEDIKIKVYCDIVNWIEE